MQKLVKLEIGILLEGKDTTSTAVQGAVTAEDISNALLAYRQDDDGLLDFTVSLKSCEKTDRRSLA